MPVPNMCVPNMPAPDMPAPDMPAPYTSAVTPLQDCNEILCKYLINSDYMSHIVTVDSGNDYDSDIIWETSCKSVNTSHFFPVLLDIFIVHTCRFANTDV